MNAYEDVNMKVDFKLKRDQNNKSIHIIHALYSNKTSYIVTDLNMLVSVKKYLKLELFSVSSSSMAPNTMNGSTQEMKITNTAEGSQPLVVRIKITYKINGSPFEQTKVIDSFPAY